MPGIAVAAKSTKTQSRSERSWSRMDMDGQPKMVSLDITMISPSDPEAQRGLQEAGAAW